MYEAELHDATETAAQIPPEVLERFGELTGRVAERTLLTWGEHCTECQYPACYTTCSLYTPRLDRHCRLFLGGAVRIDIPGAVTPYLLKIRFKRWGKLWTPGNTRLLSTARAAALEKRDIRYGELLANPLLPVALRRSLVRKRSGLKARLARYHRRHGRRPSHFVFECYNPNPGPLSVTISVKPEGPAHLLPYQKRVALPPGFTRDRTAVEDILAVMDLSQPFQVEVTPNDVAEGTALVFGLMDFVREKESGKAPVCKCVVWDLDNTLWTGVLVEEGPEGVVLKEGVAEVIRELDRRGILQSIASKNDEAEALGLLRRLGLEEYFVHPQIGWGAKSEGVRRIASALNVSPDTVLYVDDQAFEREEVKAAFPQATTVGAEDSLALPDRPECRLPVTAESAGRRALYLREAERVKAREGFGADYLGFLRSCRMRLDIRPGGADTVERVYELAQRTNQMNFSGNRYERARLAEIMAAGHLDTYVLQCEDRFGTYGIVGFAVVDRRQPRLLDLMFSCRIQSKRVEHAFLGFLLEKYLARAAALHADYRKTDRNAPSGRVFAEMGFEEEGVEDGVTRLRFPQGKPVPRDGVIAITVAEA